MALIHCPECRKKMSTQAEFCPHCGFSFKPETLESYRQKLEEQRLLNAEINRKSAKLHLVWLCIFILVIAIASLVTHA